MGLLFALKSPQFPQTVSYSLLKVECSAFNPNLPDKTEVRGMWGSANKWTGVAIIYGKFEPICKTEEGQSKTILDITV